ncbi:hypothetical protein [Roseateles depolymerans]|uniref:Uncharacterized protein n=1 Tax=Roseateles depolymerans TaxID=76731 RepID=A0A0U3MXV9_9BURK|nr:hypothetical protein [Roseateles depolymerans]ALV06708.1 hypothetical protein RD2015_2236 [Roseateles depolymerans]REG19685.1 hypothetical protein DES44_2185 [Roseateles depolymerans]
MAKITIIVRPPAPPADYWTASNWDGEITMGGWTLSAAQAADEAALIAFGRDAYPAYDEFEVQYPDGVPAVGDTSNGGGGPGPRL